MTKSLLLLALIPELQLQLVPGRDFLLGRTEVTQACWQEVMGTNPSRHVGADLPVECVSWNDCQDFIAKLNARPEAKSKLLRFRLPEHEEWTYAARAGGREPCADAGSWHAGNAGGETHPVGTKATNAWGFADMRGNVAEWTATPDGATRDVVGGAYCHFPGQFPDAVENVHPHRYFPDRCFDFLGLRLAADCPALVKSPKAVFSVRAFGAKGDGVTKDTAAIQRAIDAAHAAGGGTVELGEGTYLSGSIFLRSNVDFFLGPNARLLASPDPADFNAQDVCAQNSYSKGENASGAHLLLCIEQENVTLRGPGTVDGNAPKYLLDANGRSYRMKQIPWRMSQLVYFVESKNLRLEDLRVRGAHYWSVFLHGCTDAVVRGLDVASGREYHSASEPLTPQGDGLDLDCCRHVRVSDCRVSSNDDGITLRASSRRLKNPQDTSDVVISNCVVSSRSCAFRLGVGDRTVRDVTIGNVVIFNAYVAIDFCTSWGAGGVSYDNIRIDDVDVRDARFFFRGSYNTSKASVMENIRLSNVRARCYEPSVLWGQPGRPVRNVSFVNVDCNMPIDIAHGENCTITGGTLRRAELTPAEAEVRNRLIARGYHPN